MDVAIVVKEFPPDVIGGAETQTKRMASELADRDHEVTVFTKRYGDHDDDLDYEVARVPNLRVNSFLSDLTFIFCCLITLLRRRNEFDVLQCMMVYPIGCLGYLANRLAGISYFAWVRGNDFYRERHHPIKRRMMRAVFKDTRVLVQSPDVKGDVESFFGEAASAFDLRVLGNGVSIPEERALPAESETVLYLGRLAPKKGLDGLFEAVATIDREVDLQIVGDGSERDRLEELSDKLGLTVTFVGEVPPENVDQYYREAGIFVLPSDEGEGLPNAVLEAMSWGLPVVATDSGGLPTLIADSETGFVVDRGHPEEISRRLRQLLADPELRDQMGYTGRERVRSKYSWDSLCSELEQIYRVVNE